MAKYTQQQLRIIRAKAARANKLTPALRSSGRRWPTPAKPVDLNAPVEILMLGWTQVPGDRKKLDEVFIQNDVVTAINLADLKQNLGLTDMTLLAEDINAAAAEGTVYATFDPYAEDVRRQTALLIASSPEALLALDREARLSI